MRRIQKLYYQLQKRYKLWRLRRKKKPLSRRLLRIRLFIARHTKFPLGPTFFRGKRIADLSNYHYFQMLKLSRARRVTSETVHPIFSSYPVRHSLW